MKKVLITVLLDRVASLLKSARAAISILEEPQIDARYIWRRWVFIKGILTISRYCPGDYKGKTPVIAIK